MYFIHTMSIHRHNTFEIGMRYTHEESRLNEIFRDVKVHRGSNVEYIINGITGALAAFAIIHRNN